jgi:hypothetical protein
VAKETAEYRLQNGQIVFFETETTTDYGEANVSLFSDDPLDAGPPRLSETLDKILPALSEIAGKISSLNLKPDEIELEVGIKFVGEAGVVFAKASAEATLVVTLKWKPQRTAT